MPFTVAEFFAGGGMARAALGADWETVFANDIDHQKCATYRQNWTSEVLVEGDVAKVNPRLLERPIDLYWASSPCQDFSLAGKGAGLAGTRSGAFAPWFSLVQQVAAQGFGPKIIAFENVTGLLTSRNGADFRQIVSAFASLGYRCGALEIDAKDFLPQSRPRLFVVALRSDLDVPSELCLAGPSGYGHSRRLDTLAGGLSGLVPNWIWWKLPAPDLRDRPTLELLLDPDGSHVWFARAEVARILDMMSPLNRAKVRAAQEEETHRIGTIYRRGRPDETGRVVQRAEVRLDGIAGCLRTPAGGSSRQTLISIHGDDIGMRLLSAREAARLMGLPDTYKLPVSYNDAYKLAGDGLAVPVVRHLAVALLRPLLSAQARRQAA